MSCTYKPSEKVTKTRCCQTGCDNCPWGFKLDPQKPLELQVKNASSEEEDVDLDLVESYLEDEELNPDD